MSTTAPRLLILPSLPDAASDLKLPPTPHNIFHRLIRNLHAESDHPRERECTEMLAAVLLNAPSIRDHVLRWMATSMGMAPNVLDGLTLRIQTEQSIGAKRDDLRIEATTVEGKGYSPVLLWTVEVKVGAYFHGSTLQAAEPEGAADAGELVNQIVNYDCWLAQQPHRHRGGFVLALSDLTADLPKSLTCPWTCLTWTGLGVVLQGALRGQLPPQEALLAKHLLGFLMTHLWRSSEMPDARLDFDDLALLRAFEQIGDECGKKVDRLVAPLLGLVTESGVGQGKVSHQQQIFGTSSRSVVWRFLFADSAARRSPILMAGINGEAMVLWIELAIGNANKQEVHAAVTAVLDPLKKRNPAWQQPDDDGFWDLMIEAPLAKLLVAEDQQVVLIEFVGNALTDLLAVGAVREIGRAVGEKME